MTEQSYCVEATVKVRLNLSAIDEDDAHDKAEENIVNALCSLRGATTEMTDVYYMEIERNK